MDSFCSDVAVYCS